MINSLRFESFIDNSSTKAFIAIDGDNIKWVLKADGNPAGIRVVFNDYIAGNSIVYRNDAYVA